MTGASISSLKKLLGLLPKPELLAIFRLYLQCMCIAMYVVCYSLKSVVSMEHVALQHGPSQFHQHHIWEGCNLYSSIIIQFLLHTYYTLVQTYML